MKLTGKIIQVGDVETFASGFTKRQFVIETQEEYPQMIPLELLKDAVNKVTFDMLDSIVEVDINIRGREYNGKYFVNLQAWRVVKNTTVEAPATSKDGLPF